MEKMYGVAQKLCSVHQRDTFMALVDRVVEWDLRKLLKDGVTICPDDRMTALPLWNLIGNDIHGAFYTLNGLKVLALRNDPSLLLGRTLNTVHTFNSKNVLGTTPPNAVRYGVTVSTLGSLGGSREARTNASWGPEDMSKSVAEQVREKSLATPPLNPAFKP